MNQDVEHLQLLSVFHYVVAALVGLFSLFPIFHLVMGIMMLTGRFPDGQTPEAPFNFMGWFFVVFAVVWIVCGLTFAICLLYAGRFLTQHRRYLFCLVIAGLSCMLMPFGTVLGVFTILVLMRPSVRELFGVA